MSGIREVCILGFGEVGQILGDDLAATADVGLRSFDILFAEPASLPALAAGARPHVAAGPSASAAAAGADLIISVVTASEAVAAARSVVAYLTPGCYFLDLNSVSPPTRLDAAAAIEAGGGRYVEGAIMSSIGSRRIASPILLGGPHAASFSPTAASLGFTDTRAISDTVGKASAVKMCRSVLIKGIEALLAESLVTAGRYGVADDVLASLNDLLPMDDWPGRARYMISRSLQHGERRAEEIREAARTVASAGLRPWMSEATVKRQDWAAGYATARDKDLTDMLATLLPPGASGEEDDFDG